MSDWFYRHDDQPVGPFDRKVLDQLNAAGIIDQSTMVKGAGDETWRAFGKLVAPSPPKPEIQEPVPDSEAARFYYLDGGRRPVGPFPREVTLGLCHEGVINASTLVSGKGDNQWIAAGQFLGLPPEPPKSPTANESATIREALPVRRDFDKFALLMGATLTLYVFYLIPTNSRDMKAITGRPRMEFLPLLVFGVLSVGIVTVVMMCLWAYDLERHGLAQKTPDRMEYLGTYVLALNILAFVISLFSGWLAMILGLVLGAAAVWLLEKEINIYAPVAS